MAIFLYRLGKASYRRAGRVLLAWLAALVAIGGVGFGFAGQTDEEFRIPGSESQEAFDRLEAVFPAFAGASAQAVLVAPDGERLDQAEYRSLIIRLTGAIDRLDGVEEAVHPFEEFAEQALSADASTAFIQIQFDAAAPEVPDELLDSLLATRSVVEGSGLTLEFGGTVFQDQQVGLTIAEVFGVMFAGLVLIVTFRSVRPAWMPLASAIIGVGIILGILFFSSNFIVLSSSSPLLAVMLGLAVGIDYSLFILSRHRTQLAAGEEPEESAAIAVGTQGIPPSCMGPCSRTRSQSWPCAWSGKASPHARMPARRQHRDPEAAGPGLKQPRGSMRTWRLSSWIVRLRTTR